MIKKISLPTLEHHVHLLVLLVVLMALGACTPQTIKLQPKVTQGILDLRNWDFSNDGPVKLDGDWELYWDKSFRSLEPQAKASEFVRVPGAWLENQHPAIGKAVYRVRILTSNASQVLGIKLYEFPQSYRLYINNNFLIENGKYSEAPGHNNRSLVRPFVVFANSSATIDLAIEAVNSLSTEEPGPRRSIILGLEPSVRQVQDGQLISDMLTTGILIIMGAYHLGLYLQRRRETGSLLFGLLCLIMIFRIAVTEEHYLQKYIPAFPGDLEHFFDVFSFFILVPAFAWIFQNFFEKDFDKRILNLIFGAFLVIGGLYLLTSVEIFFEAYLAFTLLVGFYLTYVLVLGVKFRRSGSGVFLAGFLIFIATSIWDILSFTNIVRAIYVSQIGFVCFIFSQAYVLSMRFNQALNTSEKLTLNLEGLVVERTQALEESNQKLSVLNITDALTGIANRRHFDEVLQLEWNRALRDHTPLGLLILDIDHFKAYNDFYGHQGGDACLKTVTEVLSAHVRRAGDTLARYGGEEFVILLAKSSTQEALELAEHLRQAVEARAIPHQKSTIGHVSISIGVTSLIPSETTSAAQLVNIADQALYRAKDLGRNRTATA
jgi:diguanylate cyclase (GGDEF)-like protein